MSPLGETPPASEITPHPLYMRRREFIKNSLLFTATSAGVGGTLLWLMKGARSGKPAASVRSDAGPTGGTSPAGEATGRPEAPSPFDALKKSPFSTDEVRTPFDAVSGYNNFYEFGVDKSDPAQYASTLRPRPWTVAVEGEVHKPQTLDIDQILRLSPLEERVYRMRCVEAWSMVVPWAGFPLADLLRIVEPKISARYVAFTTLDDPEQMPGQKRSILEWPYVEGLRLDEALHPLTLLAVGVYGRPLPNQNGAPLRLVVPWKYGFKGIKSIVRIRVTEQPPPTTWNLSAPNEYGFYANVNPSVDHPRWSQATERRLGELRRRPTLPFNGYAEQVGALYSGMDLRADF